MTTDSAAALREWARGMFTTEAATELLIRSFGGRFAAAGNPWVKPRGGRDRWLDFDVIPGQVGALSSGERALLLIAASIGGASEVDLSDSLCSLNRGHLALVLAAMAHASGSHCHTSFGFETATSGSPNVRAHSLFPWPD